jgi:non-heme chloroperoxidase
MSSMRARLTGDGPPVVLLHGQPGGARDWELVAPALAGHALLVPDRAGYDGRRALGFFGNAADVVALLDEHRVGRAVVVGYSWAAGAAVAAAALRPDRVAGLTLVAPVGVRAAYGFADVALSWRPVGGVFAGLMRTAGPALAKSTARANGSALGAAELHRLRLDLDLARCGPAWRSFGYEQRALIRETEAIERLLPVTSAPTVVVAGRRDRSVPLAAVRRLAALLPDAVLREVDAGHLLPLEAPAAVTAAIVETVGRSGCGRRADESEPARP